MRARATSMASAEVPDIRPRTSDDLGGIGARKKISPQRARRAQRRNGRGGEKDNACLNVEAWAVGAQHAAPLREHYEICFFRSDRRFRASRGFKWSRSAAR